LRYNNDNDDDDDNNNNNYYYYNNNKHICKAPTSEALAAVGCVC